MEKTIFVIWIVVVALYTTATLADLGPVKTSKSYSIVDKPFIIYTPQK